MNNIKCLYQDEYLIVINKPSGLLTHRSDIDKYETQNAVDLLEQQVGKAVFPIHRLDKPTSGALVFALDKSTANKLSSDFVAQKIKKKYLALVRGFTQEEAIIDYPLKVLWSSKNKTSQEAVTEYKRLIITEIPYPVGKYQTSRYSLLEVSPKTGRSRQIRRHLKHVFHPIVGDTAHGDGKHNTLFREQFNVYRLLLHAWKLEFIHPHSQEKISVTAPLDFVFKSVLEKLKMATSTFNL